MDSTGARHLSARLRARVAVGTEIVLDCDVPESGLRTGDAGLVSEITPDGVVIQWERGISTTIDPETVQYHAV